MKEFYFKHCVSKRDIIYDFRLIFRKVANENLYHIMVQYMQYFHGKKRGKKRQMRMQQQQV